LHPERGGGGGRLSNIFAWVADKISARLLTKDKYVTTDTMLQKCAGIKEYVEELPNAKATTFKEKDILLSNIRPYLQKLWLATYSGGCSNDVLVLRVKNEKKDNPLFYAEYLKRPKFFEYIMQDVNGTKMPRGKKPHIMRYSVPVVDLEIQNEIVQKIKTFKIQIQEAEKQLEILSQKTKEILNNYLQ
jgi:restriction endonuclease S subunit